MKRAESLSERFSADFVTVPFSIKKVPSRVKPAYRMLRDPPADIRSALPTTALRVLNHIVERRRTATSHEQRRFTAYDALRGNPSPLVLSGEYRNPRIATQLF
jgi:hypothetical protein